MLGGKNSAVMFICLVETKCFNIVTLESVKGHPHLAGNCVADPSTLSKFPATCSKIAGNTGIHT